MVPLITDPPFCAADDNDNSNTRTGTTPLFIDASLEGFAARRN
jgi:hypothetical protein